MTAIKKNTYMVLMVVSVLYVHTQSKEYTLTILHLNDFHARFEETNAVSGRCSPEDKSARRCYGGFARIQTKVKELRRSKPNVLFMGAGDYFQGTLWYTIHKWRPMARFLNMLHQDVMSLGNHEFDDGVSGLVPFLDNVTFPVLAANIDVTNEPLMKGKVLPSIVLERGGRRIGIVGYVTTETPTISNSGKVVFLEEVDSVRRESRRLKRNGVDIIIALGHSGFRKDLEIARNVEDVDIIVGGHSNTFLYTGEEPSDEQSEGEYPTVVKQESGRVVLVVQAYSFGKYLGYLEATFDSAGEVLGWVGNPILLDSSVPQDPAILKELVPYRKQVHDYITEEIGRTFVFLGVNHDICSLGECNLGNLITDAMVHQNVKYPDDNKWTTVGLAIMNGGGIRSSIDERSSNGSILMEDILAVAPFQNTIDIVELRGRHVREMFEFSVKKYDATGMFAPDEFLQVSGFHVVYDISKPTGSRVVSLTARCISCRVPEMMPVQDEKIYKIAMPSFLVKGGDGHTVIRDQKVNHVIGQLDSVVISQYIRHLSPIYIGLEGRIEFIQSSFEYPAICTGASANINTLSYEVEDGQVTSSSCSFDVLLLFILHCFIFSQFVTMRYKYIV